MYICQVLAEREKNLEYQMVRCYIHMKKMQLAINSDGVDDEKIFKDLYLLSNGEIKLDTENYHLHQFKEIHPQQPSNKRKKKGTLRFEVKVSIHVR